MVIVPQIKKGKGSSGFVRQTGLGLWRRSFLRALYGLLRDEKPPCIGGFLLQTLRAWLRLMQLRVLRFGLFQDRDVWIGVLPDGEELLVGNFCFRRFTSHRISAADLKVRQGSGHKVSDNAPVVEQRLLASYESLAGGAR